MCTEEAAGGSFFVYSERGGKSNLLKNYQICEKNIKNIMSVETAEKEIVREYNKNIDKQKNNNKFEENKGKK